MTAKPESVAQARQLMGSLRQVNRSMTHLMRIQADACGLTPDQMLVLRTLAEASNLSLSELANRVQLGCSTVSGVVKRLVECGLVERDRLDEDQRTVSIRLTQKGTQLEHEVFSDDSLTSKALERLLQLPEQDIETLLKLHKELIDVLNVE